MEWVVGGKFKIGRKIGSGSFGEIYIGNLFISILLFNIHIHIHMLIIFFLFAASDMDTSEVVAVKMVCFFFFHFSSLFIISSSSQILLKFHYLCIIPVIQGIHEFILMRSTFCSWI